MPREAIHDQTGPFDIDVSWGRPLESAVQVSVRAEEGTDRIVRIVNEWLTAAGWPPIDLDKLRATLAEAGKPEPWFNGWHATLAERHQVNDLIFLLRKARDRAYGKDA